MRYRIGEIGEPCGMPVGVEMRSDTPSGIWILVLRPVRNVSTYGTKCPSRRFRMLCSKRAWCVLSYAPETSNRSMETTAKPLPQALRILSNMI